MATYFSTFISGTDEFIKAKLQKKSSKIKIISIYDGLVIYESSYSINDIRSLRFFNNSFLFLKFFKELSIKDGINHVLKSLGSEDKILRRLEMDARNIGARNKTFKIVTSLENQTVSVNRESLVRIEEKISKVAKLKLSVKNPDIELWAIARKEGFGLLGIRITYPVRAGIQKGELRPDLAHIMCLLSEPKPSDIFLDPFAGHGSIPIERAKSFPYKKVIALEIDPVLVRELKNKLPKKANAMFVEQGDALSIKLSDGSVDSIVTDPPWGFYKETEIPIAKFYENMLHELHRVLRIRGILVVLVADRNLLKNILTGFRGLSILEEYEILVSGKKAVIYKIIKKL